MDPTTPALNPDPSIETGALFLDIDKVCDLASEWSQHDFCFPLGKSQALWAMGGTVFMGLGLGRQIPPCLEAANQWLRLGGDVRHRHQAILWRGEQEQGVVKRPDPSIKTGALFLDIDKVCDLASEWPHMMPPAQVILPLAQVMVPLLFFFITFEHRVEFDAGL
jgi:hypothetical protein